MRDAVRGVEMLRQNLEQSLRELDQERRQIRQQVPEAGRQFEQWAELERRVCIAELVGRKATPSARRTVDGTLAALRAFRAGLPAGTSLN